MAKYLKRGEVAAFTDIEDNMRQVFHHEFSKNVYKNEIISMKQEGAITEEDLLIAKAMFQFRFATLEQLHEAVGSSKNMNAFYSRLEKLLQYRIINKFMMTYGQEDHFQADAYTVYCLDIGGQSLLTHFWNVDDLLDWYYILNIVTGELVSRFLMITDIALSFSRTNPDQMDYFKANPNLRLGNQTMVPAFEICFRKGDHVTYFVGEVVRKQEKAIFREKALKWNRLLKTNTWKKYYHGDSDKPPVLLVVCGDDLTALYIGKVLTETAELDVFRLTTEERIKVPLYEKGVFMKYVPEQNQLKKTSIINFRPASTTAPAEETEE